MRTRCVLVLKFYHTFKKVDRFLNFVIGTPRGSQPIHCDIRVICNQFCDMNDVFFTSFMGEEFRRVVKDQVPTCFEEDCGSHTVLMMPITLHEHHTFCTFLTDLHRKHVSYNTCDLVLLAMHNSALVNYMFPDNCTTGVISDIHRLYCSQAALVIMRECLVDESHEYMVEQLRAVNSRSISPSQLKEMLLPYMTPISCADLREMESNLFHPAYSREMVYRQCLHGG
jgi:hypothetical protein